MTDHKTISLGERHPPIQVEYADSVARLAATEFVVTDLSLFARQLDDNTVWMLVNTATPTWIEITGGGAGIPGGADTQIQFNDGGSFGGSPNFLWDNTARLQTLLGNLDQQGGTSALNYAPVTVGTVGTGTNPRLAAIYANYIYVVDSGDDDLRIFDVTDPTNPELVSTFVIAGTNLRGVAVAGRYAYLCDATLDTFYVVDVIDKSSPVIVGSVVIGGSPRGVRISGRTAFVTGNDFATGITSIDISDPANPTILQQLDTGDGIRIEFDVVGNILFVCTIAASNHVRTYDVTDPSNILLLDQFDVGSDAWSIQVQGRYAYVLSAQTGNFEILDVSDPANFPVSAVGTIALGGPTSRAVSVSGNFAYIIEQTNDELIVVDVSDPTTPVIVGRGTIGSNPVNIVTSGKYAYILDNTDNNLRVVDIGGFQVQNANIGNIDAGNLNVRRDGIFGNNLLADAASIGQGGIFSDGDIAGKGLSLLGDLEMRVGQKLLPNILDTDTYIFQLNDNEIRLFAGGDIAPPAEGGTLLQAIADGTNLRVNIAARFQESFGGLVASASTLVMSPSGNTHQITGAVTINEIDPTGWQNGSIIKLIFTTALTVTDNSGGTNDILLAPVADMLTLPGDTLTLIFDGTDWIEQTRSSFNLQVGGNMSLGGVVTGILDFTTLRQSGASADEGAIRLDNDAKVAWADNFGSAVGFIEYDTDDNWRLGISDVVEYQFSSVFANWKGNDLINVGNTTDVHSVASVPTGVVQIFVESDLPGNATEIQLSTGTVYELMAPITTTRTILHPVSGGAFSPATIRTSAKENNTLTYAVGATLPLLSSQNAQGQLILQNLIINIVAPFPFASVLGLNQTDLLTELDDTAISGGTGNSKFEKCIFNMNNNAFLSIGEEIALIDCETNIIGAFGANFTDPGVAQFEIRERNTASTDATLVTVRNTKLSSQPTESFFRIHRNLPSGSALLFDGVTPSPFTPGTGSFFGSDSGTVTGLQDSIQNPGTHTTVLATGHSALVGDFVDLSGFGVQTQYNAQFVVTFVIEGASFDVQEVFVATDTGNWSYDSLNETDSVIKVRNSEPFQKESLAFATMDLDADTIITITTATIPVVVNDANANISDVWDSLSSERWTFNQALGRLTYVGIEDRQFTIICTATMTKVGGGAALLGLTVAKNGVAVAQSKSTTQNSDPSHVTSILLGVFQTGDFIEIMVQNDDSTANVDISLANVVIN